MDRVRYALRDLSTYTDAPSLVRSFAYATGPAYGLLLDRAAPNWLNDFSHNPLAMRLDQRLGSALNLPPPDFSRLQKAEALYDGGGILRASEVAREQEKRSLRASYRARLVEGPVLTLPLANSSFQFKPASLVPLDDLGTVYPAMNLQDDWGALIVDHGGVLIRNQLKVATLSSAGFDPVTFHGDGFTLNLKPGWVVASGPRSGDFVVSRDQSAAH